MALNSAFPACKAKRISSNRLKRRALVAGSVLSALLLLAGCSTLKSPSGSAVPELDSLAGAETAAPEQPRTEPAPKPDQKEQTTARTSGVAQVQRLALMPTEVRETSGLAQVNGHFWTINDSGDDAVIYQLSDDGRRVHKQLYLAGARNIDWESLAVDDAYLYIADCGNNRARRAILTLYKVALDALSAPDGSRVGYETGTFRYGQRLEVRASDSHNFDCEAVTAVENELWLFSKNRADGHTDLYRLDKQAREQAVFPSRSYPVNGLVTAADYDPVSGRLVLLGYSRQRLFGHSFIWIIPLSKKGKGGKPAPQWSAAQRYRLNTYAQWEAISWDGPGRLVLSAERSPLSDTQIAEIRLDAKGEPVANDADADDSSLW